MKKNQQQPAARPFTDLPSFLDYVKDGLNAKGIDDEAAAALLGDGNPQVGRLILAGTIKCPIHQAPRVSRFLEGDPVRGTVIALNDYMPEVTALFAGEFDRSFACFESRVLRRAGAAGAAR